MTTTDEAVPAASQQLRDNLSKIEALTVRLVDALAKRKPVNPALSGPGMDLWLNTGAAFMKEVAENPARILEAQVKFWGQAMTHYVEASNILAKGLMQAPADPGPSDKRFKNPLWNSHPYFNFIKQQYLISSRALDEAVRSVEGLSETDRRRLEYFTRQIIDMMAPTNFLATNPDALERAIATEGESLVQGLENLVRDIEANNGDLMVTLADRAAFAVGQNIGTTPGSVVFRNRLIELIQYAPVTEKVHRTPLVIFPPWINKFYILDLKPANSMIRWLVEQGHTVFVVSWKNPDPSYRDVGIDTYIEEGYLAAINEVKRLTGEKKVNAVGYCIGGTVLSLTLALMEKRKDRSVRSATFFTTLTDFSDQGEFTPFLQNDFVDGIERQVDQDGILSSSFMSKTFSFLRANDLIYQPAIRSYMMGEAPPAFDLLYWNGDATNLPARMAREYLRGLCQEDRFTGGGFPALEETVRVSDVKVPLCAIACETDHIAPWRASFAGVAQMGAADKTFILTESGHIAGIVNPPGRQKYGHYTSVTPLADADSWKASAEFHPGSWWPSWNDWLVKHAGAMVAARLPGADGGQILAAAPGTYVVEHASA